jgi:acetyl esterase/lipase
VDDAEAVWDGLVALGFPAIAISGDSAGGGLALALMIRLRNKSKPLPVAAALFSPWEPLCQVGVIAPSRSANMAPVSSDRSALGRRSFLQMVSAGAGLASVKMGVAEAAPSEASPNAIPQPAPEFGPELNTSDIIVETLIAWGATHAFGIVGDGVNFDH